jgi:hypothetical protein
LHFFGHHVHDEENGVTTKHYTSGIDKNPNESQTYGSSDVDEAGAGSGSGEEDRSVDVPVVPLCVRGEMLGGNEQQTFALTAPALLPKGMCGGPVCIPKILPSTEANVAPSLVPSTSGHISNIGGSKRRGVPIPTPLGKPVESGTSSNEARDIASDTTSGADVLVCGMLEGIVVPTHPVEWFRGAACFVEGSELIR